MQQKPQKVVKSSNIVKKATNTPFYKRIKNFLSEEFDVNSVQTVNEFLNNLHSIDYVSLYDKTFTLEYKTLKKIRNSSYFSWDFEDDIQEIVITNDWNNSTSNLFRKCRILDAYFHEQMHEKQCDFSFISSSLKPDAFEKLLSLEFLIDFDIPYPLKLREVEARMESTHRFIELIKNGVLPITEETLYSPLVNIDDVLFSFNRFNVSNNEIKFDIDKFISRYVASIDLILTNFKNRKEYRILKNESFLIKFRLNLQKKLNEFKTDIEYIYSKLIECYNISDKFAQILHLNKQQEQDLKLKAKEYKSNDYFLNLAYQDLTDRYFYKTNTNRIHLDKRGYFEEIKDTKEISN